MDNIYVVFDTIEKRLRAWADEGEISNEISYILFGLVLLGRRLLEQLEDRHAAELTELVASTASPLYDQIANLKSEIYTLKEKLAKATVVAAARQSPPSEWMKFWLYGQYYWTNYCVEASKIMAIKAYRAETNSGLADSKNWVEAQSMSDPEFQREFDQWLSSRRVFSLAELRSAMGLIRGTPSGGEADYNRKAYELLLKWTAVSPTDVALWGRDDNMGHYEGVERRWLAEVLAIRWLEYRKEQGVALSDYDKRALAEGLARLTPTSAAT